MTIGHALTFIQRGKNDQKLRANINAAKNLSELNRVLDAEGLAFSPQEFDEAYHNRLVQCQFAEDADQIKEFRMWWDLVSQSLLLSPCGRM